MPHPVPAKPALRGGGGRADAGPSKFPPWCPQSEVRLFIGITSRCGSAEVRPGVANTCAKRTACPYPLYYERLPCEAGLGEVGHA